MRVTNGLSIERLLIQHFINRSLRAAFGSNYDEGKLIFDLLKELSSLVIQALSSVNINISSWRFIPTKKNRRIQEIDRKIEVALRSIINKRERAVKGGDEGSNDLLGLLIESNLREKNEGGVGLTNQEVTDECRLFYFAGQESTSVLLVWTLIFLSKFPHWQSLARDEIFNVFADKKPDFDGLNRLKVVTMILYEVLRLYPPVIVLNKVVNEEIRLGNVTLPAGVQVSLPMVLIHRDPEIWGDDASEFKPERFSDGISTVTNNQVAFFPFGYGPRVCIGQNFALTEAKMALAIILQNFSFGLAPSYVHAPCTVATLQPQYGALLILQKLDT
ncbi:cytochrome P450 72A397-like [Mercurialis annua]|uniref:cytochrome P450 72A397-like n=1 Tax=Mercurialis annua TaxID=3986 RepID=UPI002160572B|nr:cytochrome P450 72A397-like [Mercurialis annua]